jgi:DNA mismatch repair protein MutS2
MLLAGCEDLEFARVLAQAAGHCQSPAGRSRLASATPQSSPEQVNALLEETGEGASLLRVIAESSEPTSLSSLPESLSFLGAFAEGLMPEKEDLKALGDFLRTDVAVRKLAERVPSSRFPRITALLSGLADLSGLARGFVRKFTEEGEVRDNASTELKSIRRELAKLQTSVEDRIRGLIRHRLPAVAEEAHLSIRNNRLTVNLPAAYISQMKGLVVDYSSTRASVYVEPDEVVPMNNERQKLFLEEEAEIRRIILEYAREVLAQRPAILGNYEVMAALDVILGRARYSVAIGGVRPALTADGSLRLVDARHPLMLNNFIPESFGLSAERIAVISGVNAGGKSVLLKMIGLLVLMAAVGLYIPAEDDTEIGVFDALHVNIGDEQSVLNNLSTFTAHVGFLREMLADLAARPAGETRTLVLIDELGTGTDPNEGAALGYALLERLRELPARVVVTTHYDLIKTIGEKYPECKNVSMAFDETGLRPTYRVLDGIPGKSFAFDIAAGQGLDRGILLRAREMTEKREEQFAEVVRSLRNKQDSLDAELRQAASERVQLEGKLREAEAERQSLREREAELKRRIAELKREFELRLDEFMAGAKRRLRDKLKTGRGRSGLEVSSEYSAEVQVKKESALADLERRLGLQPLERAAPSLLRVGQILDLKALGLTGEVAAVDEERRRVELVVKGKKMILDWDKVDELLQPQLAPSGAKHLRMSRAERMRLQALGAELDAENTGELFNTAQQLDLHGHTKDEALPKLEKFISDALLNNFESVMIMHGIGTGALRSFILEWLSKCKEVASFREALPAEGGKGITIAVLK